MILRAWSQTGASGLKSRLSAAWRINLTDVLKRRDPLSERVHLGKLAVASSSAGSDRRLRRDLRLACAARLSVRDGPRPMTSAATPTSSAAPRASGSSFYAAMRILPQAQRDAMYEIYSFCRAVDDIADSTGPRAERLAQLERGAPTSRALSRHAGPARCAASAQAVKTFGLRREDFLAVIDGMEMDVVADIRAPDSPRSSFIATAWRARSAGFPCACSACRMKCRHRACRSARTRLAADQYPARSRRGRGDRAPLSSAEAMQRGGHHQRPTRPPCWPTRASSGPVAPLVARAREHFTKAERHHGQMPARAACARRASWARSTRQSCSGW